MKKILIVDDDKELLEALSIWLKGLGYGIVCATDANSAVMMSRREKPDLIILDIGLPGGDGYTIMKRLKDISPLASIPVIVLTAKDPDIAREKALAAGAAAFFNKPPDNKEFTKAIHRALHESGSMVHRKILVVDENKELQKALGSRLSSVGYEVVFGYDVSSGIMTAKKESPDLIVLDLDLPGGNGFQLMERLRNLMPSTPLIVYTGRVQETARELVEKSGAAAFIKKSEDISKPASTIPLLAAIRRALDAAGSKE